MKTLGLIGGTTWVSTVEYYRIINQEVNKRLGGVHSAKMFLYSLNFEEFKPPPDPSQWDGVIRQLLYAATRLETAGAEALLICANTPHMVADIVQREIRIPLIHIAKATASAIAKKGLKTAGLLGTRTVTEQSFYRDKFSQRQIATIVPDKEDRQFLHDTIFNEFSKGIFSEETKSGYITVINKLIGQGAEGIIFGCTEIPLLISPDECAVPVFDTTMIHAHAAVDFALGT